MRFDLHVHTDLSPCSSLGLRDILRHARRLGLDGVCLTDHGTTAVRHLVREGVQDDGLCVVIGMEYETAEGDFLVFGPSPVAQEDLPPGLPARELLHRVERAGGAAVAAHPFRASRPVGGRIWGEGLCRVVEAHNGRNTVLENRRAEEFAARHRLAATGGSDAHRLDELGRAVTRFEVPVCSRQELVWALLAGLCRPEGSLVPPVSFRSAA
ncbi:MAG: PHP domain-containing protein [Thermodesulfobacteriota bacterium]